MAEGSRGGASGISQLVHFLSAAPVHGHSALYKAYRLTHPTVFDGTPTTYAEKTRDGDAARADPNGFYHGMTVKHDGASFVLCGPPVTFVPGQADQLSLF